jgi:hypothetical protein
MAALQAAMGIKVAMEVQVKGVMEAKEVASWVANLAS